MPHWPPRRTTFIWFAALVCLVLAWCTLARAGEDSGHRLQQALDYRDQVNKRSLLLLRDYAQRSEQTLHELYQALWAQERMDQVLQQTVAEAVDAVYGEATFLSKSSFLWKAETQAQFTDAILAAFMQQFAPHYKTFTDVFIQVYAQAVLDNMQDFAKELNHIRTEEARFLPGYAALANLHLQPVMAHIAALPENPEANTELTVGDFKGAMAVVGLYGLKKVFARKIQQQFIKTIGRAAGSKVASLVGGPVGWVVGIGLIVYDAWHISRELWRIPDKLKAGFYDNLRTAYFVKAPPLFWEKIAEAVEQEFDNVILLMAPFDDLVQQWATCETYQQVTAKLSRAEVESLAQKLLLLQDQSGLDLCRLTGTFGPVLVGVAAGNISCIARATSTLQPATIAAWLTLVGNDFCALRELPVTVWSRYEPSPTSVATLRWMSTLPKMSWGSASELRVETVQWIRQHLDAFQQGRVFKGRTSDAVETEVARLAQLPPEQRMVGTRPAAAVSPPPGIGGKLGRFEPNLVSLGIWSVGAIAGISGLVLLVRWLAWLRRNLRAAMKK